MTPGGKLGWAFAVSIALLLSFGIGVWVGAEIESDVYLELLTSADLPQMCWDKIEEAAEGVIRDYESGAPAQEL